MGKLSPSQGAEGPTISDVQVLEGLESYIATTQFLHTLEQASAEWIDLSEHQHPATNLQADGVELTQVSADDAIEGMAYYIALYLSRAPEARHMEPKQLQAALKQTFTAIRRRRYRVIWDWGRWLYRATTVSYGALQLYEHPWVVRAVVAAVWTSSKMALGFLW
eukprot:gene13853-13975_t